MKALLTIPALMLSGCVASYQHLSDPRIDDDGYDLLCGGVYYEYQALTAKANLCSNVAPNGGEFVLASVEYRFSE